MFGEQIYSFGGYADPFTPDDYWEEVCSPIDNSWNNDQDEFQFELMEC